MINTVLIHVNIERSQVRATDQQRHCIVNEHHTYPHFIPVRSQETLKHRIDRNRKR